MSSAGAIRAGGWVPPIRSSSANIQIGRSPSGHIIPLNIPKGYIVYNSETKLDRMLMGSLRRTPGSAFYIGRLDGLSTSDHRLGFLHWTRGWTLYVGPQAALCTSDP
ncbi:hypothetical protein Fot_56848 [Forsythia ovata]|uniref:Uncharacterized protein n=1 Tax=Forsythia ovata TaxID=205694 RepID=A0ABD1NXX1_9LAMI